MDISIHAPREGSDVLFRHAFYHHMVFQSTLPVRGATILERLYLHFIMYFNPRSP